ncbi:hypothetical protein A2419_02660 [Candidatus Adlerbacteria bacterium RIFOXYC1_FULL_48_26]|uniref:YkuD domain-containing protein n=1 Tax=Candidatus Adlerbacteria bacterium RIFOXYC1_FULL_48_26 TaxID=1797247 RepID=A0A1F4Y1R9_9BACT|nr:MAG: hypothetical protein A2419_02660 [Candidatus Adlerbacteria bacterium RIFOXYC1_FULL_48_26]OGC93896.1 MAG: hypothetical protein A2389_02210 [Candidatus Adlerbacteria bacterium RIFOXYB1_FULL_48_10]
MKRRVLLAGSLAALLPAACKTVQEDYSYQADTTSTSYKPPVCQVGQDVHYDAARNFHIDVLVVGDGARAYSAIAEQGNNAGQTLYKTVGRYFGAMEVTWHLNVNPKRLPSHLPVLIGNGYCFGMMPVLPDGPGWSKVVASVHGKAQGGPVVNGQVALVLPRAPLTQLVDSGGKHLSFMPAVSLNIPTKYNAPIIRGRFAGQPSTQIARPGDTPGMSHVEQRVVNGEKASLFYFVHGSN